MQRSVASQSLGIFQVTDMPWVNDVEVAITEHTLLLLKQIWQIVNLRNSRFFAQVTLLLVADESVAEGTIAAKCPFHPILLLVLDLIEPAAEFQCANISVNLGVMPGSNLSKVIWQYLIAEVTYLRMLFYPLQNFWFQEVNCSISSRFLEDRPLFHEKLGLHLANLFRQFHRIEGLSESKVIIVINVDAGRSC